MRLIKPEYFGLGASLTLGVFLLWLGANLVPELAYGAITVGGIAVFAAGGFAHEIGTRLVFNDVVVTKDRPRNGQNVDTCEPDNSVNDTQLYDSDAPTDPTWKPPTAAWQFDDERDSENDKPVTYRVQS